MTDQLKPADASKLQSPDLRLLLQIFRANVKTVQMGMPLGTPFLPAHRSFKRGRALAAAGLLEIKAEAVGCGAPWPAFLITPAGIDAYNAALAATQPPGAPNAVRNQT